MLDTEQLLLKQFIKRFRHKPSLHFCWEGIRADWILSKKVHAE